MTYNAENPAPSNAEKFTLYDNISYWIDSESIEGLKWIVNVDLDYFSDAEGMRIFSNEYIECVAKEIEKSMDHIACLTIALSPDYCAEGKNIYNGWDKLIQVYSIFARNLRLPRFTDLDD